LGKGIGMKYLLLFAVITSCAQPKLYLNKEEAIPLKEYSNKTNIRTSKSITIKMITDSRKEKQYIGMAKTGVSYSPTPLELTEPFEVYLKSYLSNALIERGAIVNDAGEIQLEFVVNELWVDELIEKYQPEKAKCKTNITVYTSIGSTNWSGNFWTEIISPGDLADATERLAPTLASCMNEIVEKLVKDETFRTIIK
jgi:uncharacterized lipoprotein YajG